MAHNVIAEAKRCLNCKKPLCRQGCPVNTPIPDMISSFLSGDIKKAGKWYSKTIRFRWFAR